MEAYAGEWLQLLIRWVHLITGIAWIGASFYFIWLDNSLVAPRNASGADDSVGGELWAIHGGGFYQVQKYRVAPPALPPVLHWFKWEAYSTWWSGFALFVALYWLHADTYMIDRSVAAITPAQAVGLSAALLVAGWLVYDQLCKRLGFAHERLLGLLLVAFLTAVAWSLSHVYSGRAMYLQIGAMLGTMMAWNVYFVIIPSQRALVRAKAEGRAPDPVEGSRGKQRSVHNNYFTLPVLLTMISNHYPFTFGHANAWLVLVALLLLAAYVRHFFNLRHRVRGNRLLADRCRIGDDLGRRFEHDALRRSGDALLARPFRVARRAARRDDRLHLRERDACPARRLRRGARPGNRQRA